MNIQTNAEKKLNTIMWVVALAFGSMVGIGGTVTLQYGATKQKVEEHDSDILKLKRTAVDYVYIQDLITSNYMMIDIMKAVSGTHEMDEALKAWKDFQMNTMRRANPTRSLSSGDNGSSQ